MYKRFEERMNEQRRTVLKANLYIKDNGEYIAYSIKGQYIKGDTKDLNKEGLYKVVAVLYKQILNNERNTIENDNVIATIEKEEIEKDNCESLKNITIEISSVYPNKLLIVDNAYMGNGNWSSGSYVHILDINSSNEEVFDLVQKICDYKPGHLPGININELAKHRNFR